MRTTIRMDEDLLMAIKAEAAESGESRTSFIAEAGRRQLAGRRTFAEAPRRDLPVFAGDGVLPGMDIDNSSRLAEVVGDRGTSSMST